MSTGGPGGRVEDEEEKGVQRGPGRGGGLGVGGGKWGVKRNQVVSASRSVYNMDFSAKSSIE